MNAIASLSKPADSRLEEKVAPLARQLPWAQNLIIFGQGKCSEERELYALNTAQGDGQ